MNLLGLVLLLLGFALVGFLVYLIVTYIPMPEPFKQVIIVACVVLIVLYLLAIIFGGAALPTMPLARGLR